jgi:hypothetical protein
LEDIRHTLKGKMIIMYAKKITKDISKVEEGQEGMMTAMIQEMPFFTNGNALGILNIFLYQQIDRNWKIISENSIKCIIFSILFLAVGNYFINKDLLRGIRNIGKK